MPTNSSDYRTTLALTTVALCVLVAVVVAVAASGTDGTSTMNHGAESSGVDVGIRADGAIDSRSVDREPGTTYLGLPDNRATQWTASQQGAAPVGSTQGQLFGIVLILVVLAVIGAAAWGVRPAVLGRLGRSLRWRSGAPDLSNDGPTQDELMTDEERIIDLLQRNGGRLKQQHVVETTDWSKAKVSRLLSSMEDNDAIVRIQLGREKLIFLRGHEPNSVRSAFGEDR